MRCTAVLRVRCASGLRHVRRSSGAEQGGNSTCVKGRTRLDDGWMRTSESALRHAPGWCRHGPPCMPCVRTRVLARTGCLADGLHHAGKYLIVRLRGSDAMQMQMRGHSTRVSLRKRLDWVWIWIWIWL